jgi:hypothetical protein
MKTGNIGEWSEIYTLFKLCCDGELVVGDEDFRPITSKKSKVKKIRRLHSGQTLEFSILKEKVRVSGNGATPKEINKIEFRSKSEEILNRIKKKDFVKKKPGSFGMPTIESFMDDIGISNIKAGSSETSDLQVEIDDNRRKIKQFLGFSVKSELGGPAHILNSSNHTAFSYVLKKFPKNRISIFNKKKRKHKVLEMIRELESLSLAGQISIFPKDLKSDTFRQNLMLLDDGLPTLLSSLLWEAYLRGEMKLIEVMPCLACKDPNKYSSRNRELLYTYKVKRFLVACAMGMKPGSAWDGVFQAKGGYIIVLNSGELVSYYISDKEDFEQLLLNNARQDSPSTNPKKSNYAYLYLDERNEVCFDLQISLRFLK